MSAKKEAWKKRQIEKRQRIDEERIEGLYQLINSANPEEWLKPWYNLPQQNKDGNVYSVGNQLNLFKSTVENNYDDPRWYTFNQIKKNGWKLKKGSKATPIYFTTNTAIVNERDDDGNFVLDENGKRKKMLIFLDKPVIKIYDMFNGSCIEGLPKHENTVLTPEQKADFNRLKHVEELTNKYSQETGIPINNVSGSHAFFRASLSKEDKEDDPLIQVKPEKSKIVMPLKSQFDSPDGYYKVLLHEVVHSTKAIGARPLENKDVKDKAREELIAELGSLFLSQELKIDPDNKVMEKDKNSLNYLKGWMENGTLDKEDLKFAVQQADKAIGLIKNPEKAMKIYKEKRKSLEKKAVKAVKKKTTQKMKLA